MKSLNQGSLHMRRFSKRQYIWTSDEAVHNSSVDFKESIQNIPQPQQPQTQQKQQQPQQQQQKQAKQASAVMTSATISTYRTIDRTKQKSRYL